MENGRFLTAEWRFLAMLNFTIDPGVLSPFVPIGTELDAWNGQTFVSVVGFRFLRTRVFGLTIPFHRNFLEVNLRFYVRRKAPDGWRRAVVFIKEIVPRRAIAAVARRRYNENYVALPMRARVTPPDHPDSGAGSLEYSWRVGQSWNTIQATFGGPASYPVKGSEAEFITEHYWGYVSQRDRSTLEYYVEHPQWRVWQATNARLVGDVAELYGAQFQDALSQPASSAFVAEGSEVAVSRGVRLEA